MLPLEQNTVSALLAKFIAARVFIIIMFSAFLWILLHLFFALHLTYISQYLLFSFQLQEGDWDFLQKYWTLVFLLLLSSLLHIIITFWKIFFLVEIFETIAFLNNTVSGNLRKYEVCLWFLYLNIFLLLKYK